MRLMGLYTYIYIYTRCFREDLFLYFSLGCRTLLSAQWNFIVGCSFSLSSSSGTRRRDEDRLNIYNIWADVEGEFFISNWAHKCAITEEMCGIRAESTVSCRNSRRVSTWKIRAADSRRVSAIFVLYLAYIILLFENQLTFVASGGREIRERECENGATSLLFWCRWLYPTWKSLLYCQNSLR